MQHTVASTLTFSGVGVHSGATSRLGIHPAPAGSGLCFVRADIAGARPILVSYDRVQLDKAVLCTWLENEDGVYVQTIEHILSALYAFDIDNAILRLEGAEVPVLDGSSLPFITALRAAGRTMQQSPRTILRIQKPVRINDGAKSAALLPDAGSDTLTLSYHVDYPGLGAQSLTFRMGDAAEYAHAIAPARTFTMKSVVEKMQAAGLGLGGSLDNAVVLDDATGKPVAGQTLRFEDEAVRHKMLDAIGDLALAGHPIAGRFECTRGGHALTNKLLRALFADPANYSLEQSFAGITVGASPARAPAVA